jgi:hypothetical protein
MVTGFEEAGGWASNKMERGHFQAIAKIDSVRYRIRFGFPLMSIGMSFICETYRSRVTAMKTMSSPAVWTLMTVAMAGAIASDAAQARSAFDGGWAVQIVTQRGACDPSSGFGVEIRDGVIYGAGGMPVHGRVASNGAVTVSVASGEQRASGSGRLSGSSGGGSWHGVGARGACSGRWSASRQ